MAMRLGTAAEQPGRQVPGRGRAGWKGRVVLTHPSSRDFLLPLWEMTQMKPLHGTEQRQEGEGWAGCAGSRFQAQPCPVKTFPPPPQYLILVLLVGKEAPGGDHGYETGKGWDLNLCSLLYGRAHKLESGSRVRHQY